MSLLAADGLSTEPQRVGCVVRQIGAYSYRRRPSSCFEWLHLTGLTESEATTLDIIIRYIRQLPTSDRGSLDAHLGMYCQSSTRATSLRMVRTSLVRVPSLRH